MIAILRDSQEADLKFREGGNTRGLVEIEDPWIGKANDQERLRKALIPFSFDIQGGTVPTPLASCVSVNKEASSQGKHKSHC